MTNTVPQWDNLPDLSWKEKVAYLTHQFLTMEQTGCPLTHRFEKGLYIREIRIPAETLIVGRVHRHGHVCQLLEGDVILIHSEGYREGFHAPSQIMTEPGYQMVLYAVTDVVAQTVHPNPTNERDTEKLVTDIFESIDSLSKLGHQIHERVNYSRMLADLNIDEAVLKPLIEDESDQIPFTDEYPIQVRQSDIHGKGIFAIRDIVSHERIAPARVGGMRTPAGRYTNHSSIPNAQMSRVESGNIELVALKDIPQGHEISVDYRHSILVGLT